MSDKIENHFGVKDKASPSIDYEKCDHCGLCLLVDMENALAERDGKVVVEDRLIGCKACGQCITVCPTGAISVTGRGHLHEFLVDLPSESTRANYEQLYALLLARRSKRQFKKKEVEQDIIDKILDICSLAPMGIPPSTVDILVLNGRKRVREFRRDVANSLMKMRWMTTRMGRLILRPFVEKPVLNDLECMFGPFLKSMSERQKQGVDILLYDAPLGMYFSVPTFSEQADPIICATYAILAAESLGLGACMIGSVSMAIKSQKGLKAKYDIPAGNKTGLMVVMGYPKIKTLRSIKRKIYNIHYFSN